MCRLRPKTHTHLEEGDRGWGYALTNSRKSCLSANTLQFNAITWLVGMARGKEMKTLSD